MWVIYSLLGAFFQATEMAIKKKALQTRGVNNFIAFIAFTFAGLLLWGFYFWQAGNLWPNYELTGKFWQGMFWGVTLNILAVYFLYKALDMADLSYLMPYMTLTSLTLIVPPIIIFGEIPSVMGFVGIVFIVSGALVMEIKKKTRCPEFKETARKNRKGLMYFLVTAGCFTITPTALTLAVRESSVLFTSFLSHLLIGIGFIFLIIVFKETGRAKEILSDKQIKRGFLVAVILAGLSIAIANTSINAALDVQKVAYVMGIKRLMPLFAFVIGLVYFKERQDIPKKILATLLMVAGAVLITVF